MSEGAQPVHPPLAQLDARPRHPKNIVICCDGTGNQFGDANSNVVKFYTALEISSDQIGYYHPGVGTMGDPNQQHRVAREWSRIKGLAFGAGFKTNVLDAYRYLMETYNDGDRVCLIGFSRGGYTVRALAGLLDGYGLLCRGNEGHLPYAWRLYVDQHHERTQRCIDPSIDAAAAFKQTFSHTDFKLHFVGIWDTVSSVGWIYTPLRLFNVAQNKTILTGRQAVSIDERRCFYQDNLWGDSLPGQDIQQVWFAGVHSDVGGSYPQATSGLSNVSLQWMLLQAHNAGIRLVPERVSLVLGDPTSSYPAVQPFYRKPDSSPVHHSLNWKWWLLEFFPHIFYDKDLGEEVRRIPLGSWRQIPDGALIHSSVAQRCKDENAQYAPRNLKLEDLSPLAGGPTDPAGNPLLFVYHPSGTPQTDSKKRLLLWPLAILESLLGLLILFFAVAAAFWILLRLFHLLCKAAGC